MEAVTQVAEDGKTKTQLKKLAKREKKLAKFEAKQSKPNLDSSKVSCSLLSLKTHSVSSRPKS